MSDGLTYQQGVVSGKIKPIPLPPPEPLPDQHGMTNTSPDALGLGPDQRAALAQALGASGVNQFNNLSPMLKAAVIAHPESLPNATAPATSGTSGYSPMVIVGVAAVALLLLVRL